MEGRFCKAVTVLNTEGKVANLPDTVKCFCHQRQPSGAAPEVCLWVTFPAASLEPGAEDRLQELGRASLPVTVFLPRVSCPTSSPYGAWDISESHRWAGRRPGAGLRAICQRAAPSCCHLPGMCQMHSEASCQNPGGAGCVAAGVWGPNRVGTPRIRSSPAICRL